MASSVLKIRRNQLENFVELGSGAFSTVYKVRYEQPYQQCVRCHGDIPPPQPSYVAVKKLNVVDRKELELLSKLEHPYVIKLVGVVDEIPEFYLVLELCEGGSLRGYLNKHKDKPVDLLKACAWIEQGAIALRYLHEQNIIHRDLKADNFLISRTRNLKVCDLGISKNAERTITVSSLKGTFGWTAPECFEDQEHVSPLSDIYSFATVIWEILTRLIPFEKCEYQHVMYRVCSEGERPKIPDDFHPMIVELLTKCWNAERKERPSIGEVVKTVSNIRKHIRSSSNSDTKTLAECLPYTCAKVEVFEGQTASNIDRREITLAVNRRAGAERRRRLGRRHSPLSQYEQEHYYDGSCKCEAHGNSQGVIKLHKNKPFQLYQLVKNSTAEPSSKTGKEDPSDPQRFLWIPHGSSVAEVKKLIDKDMPLGHMHLFASSTKSRELKDEETLIDHKMCGERAILHLSVDAEVVVIRLNGASEAFSVNHHDNISVIKDKICTKLGFLPKTQQLLCNGKTLHNLHAISHFVDDKFKAFFDLVCHEEITISVDVTGRRKFGTFTSPPPSIPCSIYPSQTIEELLQILVDKKWPLRALLFEGRMLYSSSFVRQFPASAQQYLIEEGIKSGSSLKDEDPIEVRIRSFSTQPDGDHMNAHGIHRRSRTYKREFERSRMERREFGYSYNRWELAQMLADEISPSNLREICMDFGEEVPHWMNTATGTDNCTSEMARTCLDDMLLTWPADLLVDSFYEHGMVEAAKILQRFGQVDEYLDMDEPYGHDGYMMTTRYGADMLVYPSQKISDVKRVIGIKLHGMLRTEENTRLVSNGIKLNDYDSILQCNIADGSKVVVERQIQVSVHVKSKTAQVTEVVVWESDTIAEVKRMVGIQPTSGGYRIRLHTADIKSRLPVLTDEAAVTLLAQTGRKATLFLLDTQYVFHVVLRFSESVSTLMHIPRLTVEVVPSSTIQDVVDVAVRKLLNYEDEYEHHVYGSYSLPRDYTVIRRVGKKKILERERTLASYHISNRTVLELGLSNYDTHMESQEDICIPEWLFEE